MSVGWSPGAAQGRLRSTATKADTGGNQKTSGGFRMPTGNWAAGTREDNDMRERTVALHRAAFLCSVFALAIAAPAIADDSGESKKRGLPVTRELKEFDTDGDGYISDEERTAAPYRRHTQRLEKFDADGDGHVSNEERAAARNQRKEQRLEEFDADGDGRLSEDELAAAHKKRQEQHIKVFDTDGDGKLSEAEKRAASEKRREHRTERSGADTGRESSKEERKAAKEKRSQQRAQDLEQFDADGDGKLTGEERQKANAARKKRRGRGPGNRPAVDQPGNAPQEP